jgi:uncharacterized membrane protein YvbJ
MSKTIAVILIIAAALVVVIFLIWKNKRDRKLLNPDAQDSVEEAMMDKDRRKDRI